ncbi:MAG: hypothetical protein ABI175_06015 [Polyangiales bacterium]
MAAGGILLAASAAAAHRTAIQIAGQMWGPYAKDKGLTFRPGRADESVLEDPRVEGELEGVSVAFQLALVGGWGITAVAVPLAPIALNLEITREGLFDKIAKVFGAKDLILGDEAFDKAYMVSTTHESARQVLTKERRDEMLSLDIATFVYDDGSAGELKPRVVLGVGRVLATPAELDRMLKLLVDVAKLRAA